MTVRKARGTSDTARGWCRLTGLAPLTLFTAVLLAVRNQRVLSAWNSRQEENTRRAAKGLAPPKPASELPPGPRPRDLC
jgi:hypothetical protein